MNKNGILGKNFRWVVPQLNSQIWTNKQQFKTNLLDKLLKSKTAKKGIKYYSIAIESHLDGNPHLDMLIILQKRTELRYTQLDFLCSKHGDLTRYRTLNHAILSYGSKQDDPLNNMPSIQYILGNQALKKAPYTFLQEHMLKDPYGFNLAQFCAKNDYFKALNGFKSLESKLKIHQEAICNLDLKFKRGIQTITPKLIQSTLTQQEYGLFLSWSGYQQIIDYLNQIPKYGSNRPFKTKHLFLVGPPDTGKTSLINQISLLAATYQMGVSNWFPRYQNHVYSLISWNEFKLDVMPYANLLRFLEGTPMDLQYKGGSTLRRDNQLVIMTSNLSFNDLAYNKWGSSLKFNLYLSSLKNFAARVTQIQIPKNKPLFILYKLIIPQI